MVNRENTMQINKTVFNVVCAILMYSAPLFTFTHFNVGNIAFAAEQESKPTKVKSSIKVPAMRNRVYGQLARAQQLADEGDKISGFDVLDEIQDRLDSLNSYEKAMLWNFYGFMYYGNDQLGLAIDSFEKVVAEQAIPQSLKLSTMYSLAQLAMQQQNYKKSLVFLIKWKDEYGKDLTASQQMFFAQVYFQDKQYKQALVHISHSINLAESKNTIPKENVFILQRAAFYELKQPENVTKVMEQLVRYYDKPQYWLQLGGMYAEIGEEDKQLAIMEAAWQAGYITKSSDITSLAQLYLYHNVPYKAASLLNEAFANGNIIPEEKNLELQAQAYIAAQESEKAIAVLKEVSVIANNGKYDAQLAQSYLNVDKWMLAIASAKMAIDRGGVKNLGTVYLVLGMANFNLKKFDLSLNALKKALTFPKSKQIAKQWTKYVEREKKHYLQLALVK